LHAGKTKAIAMPSRKKGIVVFGKDEREIFSYRLTATFRNRFLRAVR
jgi:hypothetical protein